MCFPFVVNVLLSIYFSFKNQDSRVSSSATLWPRKPLIRITSLYHQPIRNMTSHGTSSFVQMHKGGQASSVSVGEWESSSLDLVRPPARAKEQPARAVPYEQYADQDQRRQYAARLRGMTAYQRHVHFVNEFAMHYQGADRYLRRQREELERLHPARTDADVLREGHRFVRNEEDDRPVEGESSLDKYRREMAQRYYRKLHKEYAIADLSRHKTGQIGLRWRTEKEVIDGKGHFACAAKSCNERGDLRSYEVNFAYREEGIVKNTLVKVRLCPTCATKMNYKKRKDQLKRLKKEQKRKRRRDSKQEDTNGRPARKRKQTDEQKTRNKAEEDDTKDAVERLFDGIFL